MAWPLGGWQLWYRRPATNQLDAQSSPPSVERGATERATHRHRVSKLILRDEADPRAAVASPTKRPAPCATMLLRKNKASPRTMCRGVRKRNCSASYCMSRGGHKKAPMVFCSKAERFQED